LTALHKKWSVDKMDVVKGGGCCESGFSPQPWMGGELQRTPIFVNASGPSVG